MVLMEYQEEFVRNSRGARLFTCSWVPGSSSSSSSSLSSSGVRGLIFLCHGYGMECSIYMKEVGLTLAAAGYAVYGMDYEGHGRSSGARCYIKKFDHLVADCDRYYKHICGRTEYRDKARFLYGESMGGAVALLIHRRDPAFWDGAVLVAPMCKISDKVKPHPVVVNLLTKVEEVIPKWKIVPTKDVIDTAFKDPAKRGAIRANALIYQDKPRLKTALEMLRTSMRLEASLHLVSLPFLVLHGEDDAVTDPEVSRALYETAGSKDKTMRMYPGMWHGLTSGEPDENVEKVFQDIVAWLEQRAEAAGARRRAEQQAGVMTTGLGPAINRDARPIETVVRRAAAARDQWKGHSAM